MFSMEEPVRESSGDIAAIALKYYRRKTTMIQNMLDGNIYYNDSLVGFEILENIESIL